MKKAMSHDTDKTECKSYMDSDFNPRRAYKFKKDAYFRKFEALKTVEYSEGNRMISNDPFITEPT